jgi:hypothetical protein
MLSVFKDAVIEAANDTWTQVGIIGSTIAWLSKWVAITFGQILGNISLIVGISVGVLAVVEKTIGIVWNVHKMNRERKKEQDEDARDPFADTEGRK